MSYLEETIEKHKIECDYNPSGTILANVHPDQEETLRKKGEFAREHGSAAPTGARR